MAKTHKHLLVDATLNKPPTDPRAVEDWLRRLVKAVDMEIFIEPQAKYCDDPTNAGVTGFVVITTSHASLHVWSEEYQPFAKFDLYSCREFNVNDFLDMIKEFDPVTVSYTVIDRSDPHQKVLESGTVTY